MESLADEILLQIFKYLSPVDLIALSETHVHFERLISEKSLWTWMDCRHRKLEQALISDLNQKVHEGTVAYMLEGAGLKKPKDNEEVLPLVPKDVIIKWLDFNHLTVLALENQVVDANEVTLSDFPKSLRELSFNKSEIKNNYKFFHFCSRQLKDLRVFTLEYCRGLEEHILLPLGNLPALEILSLYGCMDMKDAVVPITMSFEYGFRQLKVLDVRCTGFGDELLRFASKMEQLGELYFHCYFNYTQERCQTDVDIEKLFKLNANGKDRNHGYFHWGGPEIYSPLDDSKYIQDYLQKFTNLGLLHYRKGYFNTESYVPPQSVLYERPYGKCTCSASKQAARRPSTDLPSTSKRSHSAVDGEEQEAGRSKRRKLSDINAHREKAFTIEYHFQDGTTIEQFSNKPERSNMCMIELNVNRAAFPVNFVRAMNNRVEIAVNEQEHLIEAANEANLIDRPVGIQIRHVDVHSFERKNSLIINALMLRGSNVITDFGLNSLQQLHLDLLDVTGANVSKESLASFKANMPNCRIIHESMCTCRPR